MIRELNDNRKYSSTMLTYAALSTVFGLAFAFIGELFLPLASAFLALLFILEDPKARYLSYISAVLPVIVAFIAKGIFGVVSVEYVLLALIIALTYRFGGTKAECAAYSTLLVGGFVALSLYLGGAKATGSFASDVVFDYYSDILTSLKLSLLKIFNQYLTNSGAPSEELYTVTDMTELTLQIKAQLVSFIAIVAFILVGITVKIFTSLILRVSKRGILVRFAHFIPSNIVAYVYVVALILSFFSGYETILDAVILNVSNILAAVFAYIGFRYAITLASASGRRRLAWVVILASFLIIPTAALKILSFVGVWAAIGINNAMNGKLPPSFDNKK